MRIDNINDMGSLHPDGDTPPKEDWIHDDRLKAWVKQCEQLRKDRAQYGE